MSGRGTLLVLSVSSGAKASPALSAQLEVFEVSAALGLLPAAQVRVGEEVRVRTRDCWEGRARGSIATNGYRRWNGKNPGTTRPRHSSTDKVRMEPTADVGCLTLGGRADSER